MALNIVGEISRTEVAQLNKHATDAEYAELNKLDQIQMFYRQMPIGYADGDSKNVWHYLSFANIWMGASDRMDTKRLLRIVD